MTTLTNQQARTQPLSKLPVRRSLKAAYLFSLIEIISGRAQGIPGVPATLVLAVPYLAALAALTLALLPGAATAQETW